MITLYAFIQTDQAIPALNDYHTHFHITVNSHSTSKNGNRTFNEPIGQFGEKSMFLL